MPLQCGHLRDLRWHLPRRRACLHDLHQAALWKCLRNPPSIDFMRQYLQKALIEGDGLIIGEGLKTVRLNERTAHPN